ncbi:hypothetical protein CAC42_3365 [Sphaceloma murrayae]|uniref:Ribosomal protein L1 n=1 Tax=Sphaceloma murrayae TaxID=2082308 RepID=A0A2K1R151_9PEZI|nr:hypothetical protein CAC42_3365 [Sphaceloma murrayae]
MASTDMTVDTSSSKRKYVLDPTQTLRAATALLQKMQSDLSSHSQKSGKQSLLDDASQPAQEPVWLCVTTKKHIVDKPRLKPGKIQLPHPLPTPAGPDGENQLKVCLLTADPQRYFKDLIAHDTFPAATRAKIARVIGLEKLKGRYKAFEARRQLVAEYDVFLADDRVMTYLPKLLGKVFYASGAKRPIPVCLTGKRLDTDIKGEKRVPLAKGGAKSVKAAPTGEGVAKEVERALSSALVHLSPGTNVSIKVGQTGMLAAEIKSNIEKVVEGLVETYIPQGWRNIKALYVKGPKTTSLPIWAAEEMWVDEADVLEVEPQKPLTKEQKRELKSEAKKATGLITPGVTSDGEQKVARKRSRDEGLTEEEKQEREEKRARQADRKKKMDSARADFAKQGDGLAKAVAV